MKKTRGQNTNSGITLIALVITIIVLLILAGVSIAMLTGENGVLTKATEAKNQTEIAQEKEEISMAYAASKANKVDQVADPVTASELQGELDKLNSLGVADDSNGLKVTYGERVYTIDQTTGKITGPEGAEPPEENTAENPEYWEKTTTGDSEWYSYADVSNGNTKVNANAPKLKGAMTAIKYIGSDKDSQTGSKWANAITQDGSMFVWIPRFAYKITSGYHNSEEGTIDVIFVDTNNKPLNGESATIVTDPSQVTYSGESQNEYLVHPAFTNEVNNGGGFGNKTGFWIGKFEATGTKDVVTVKAGESSLRTMTINEQYKAGKNATFGETQNLNSHMAKNSEWGATVYLAHSKYGTNGLKVERQSSGYTTGGSSTKSEIYGTNKKQSTTHNAYGVYDMNGGAWERTANYVNYGDSSSNLSTYGGTQSGDLYGTEEERNTSTAYKTVYPADGTSQSNSYNNQAKNIKGDAIYETSNSYSNGTGSWFDAYAHFPSTGIPFFLRSGGYNYSDAGTFCFTTTNGYAYSGYGFRVVLVP